MASPQKRCISLVSVELCSIWTNDLHQENHTMLLLAVRTKMAIIIMNLPCINTVSNNATSQLTESKLTVKL